MTFLGLECRNNLPKVPYCTALDYYVAISFGFIFATIIQFAVVHHFTKVGSGEYYFPHDFPSDDEEKKSNGSSSNATVANTAANATTKVAVYCTEGVPKEDAPPTPPTPVERRSTPTLFERRKSYLHRRVSMPNFHLNSVSKIDKASRVGFPFIFLIINFIYWVTYLVGSS